MLQISRVRAYAVAVTDRTACMELPANNLINEQSRLQWQATLRYHSKKLRPKCDAGINKWGSGRRFAGRPERDLQHDQKPISLSNSTSSTQVSRLGIWFDNAWAIRLSNPSVTEECWHVSTEKGIMIKQGRWFCDKISCDCFMIRPADIHVKTANFR